MGKKVKKHTKTDLSRSKKAGNTRSKWKREKRAAKKLELEEKFSAQMLKKANDLKEQDGSDPVMKPDGWISSRKFKKLKKNESKDDKKSKVSENLKNSAI